MKTKKINEIKRWGHCFQWQIMANDLNSTENKAIAKNKRYQVLQWYQMPENL